MINGFIVFALFFIVAIWILILGIMGIIKKKTYFSFGRGGGNIQQITGDGARLLGIIYTILAIVIIIIGVYIAMTLQ